MLFPLWVVAQLDTNEVIQTHGPEAVITSTLSLGQSLKAEDSDIHIANILSKKIGIQIQGQGGSYLRTALYRGQSARHMAIVWEGMNIQNQFNGTYDLGLIPTSLFNHSKWYHGSFSTALGTAAMSGALVLDQSKLTPRVRVGVNITDQSNRQLDFKFRWKTDKIVQVLGVNYWNNRNEFRYQGRQEILKRKNSDHLQKDLTYEAIFTWSSKWQSKLNYWFQNVERSLPPSTISTPISSQDDMNHRVSLSNVWQANDNVSLNASIGYMKEYIGFFQPGINSESKSDILNFNALLTLEGNLTQTFGFNLRSEHAELQDTLNPIFESFFPKRNTTSVFYDAKKKINKSILNVSLRQEMIGVELQVPVAQAAYKYAFNEDINCRISVGTNFNYPGFNDLYWPIGGNLELETEKSLQYELGFNFHKLNAKLYWINTTDKIIWAPNEQNIWTPDNISSTSSKGVELGYAFSLHRGDFIFEFTPLINYNHTINNSQGVHFGKQLLYNPKFNSRLNIKTDYKEWRLFLSHAYKSKRFQSLDNSNALDPYHLVDAELNYQLNFKGKYRSKIHLGVNNFFDQSYELVEFFPQPLRSIYLGTRISIQ